MKVTANRALSADTHIWLQPTAGPSALGLLALGAGTFAIAAVWTQWFSGTLAPAIMFPFIALAGGLMQLLAGMWAYRARDVFATVLHGIWGAFFLAYGVLYSFVAAGTITPPGIVFPEIGIWLVAMTAITWGLAFAATRVNIALFAVTGALAAASTITAIASFVHSSRAETIGGYFFLATALCAWYAGTALMMEEMTEQSILPLGRMQGEPAPEPVDSGEGEPGVMRGQWGVPMGGNSGNKGVHSGS